MVYIQKKYQNCPHKILFINPKNRLINYVNNLENNFDVKSLPYLEIDRHLSNVGHELIAEEVIRVINRKNYE